MVSKADEAKEAMRRKKMATKPYKSSDLLSTGSTMVNLACTGKVRGGFIKGHYYLFVGDSDSGKTFLCLTCLAEAAMNPNFKDHRLIYDGVEGGALMDIERFFGAAVMDRLEPPEVGKDGEAVFSSTVENFYFHLDDALNEGPCIYILDSQDALSSDAEVKKFGQRKRISQGKARKSDEDKSAGSFGDAKAKVHSSNLRLFMDPLYDTGSILIIINQTRDSFDMFQKSSYSGGRALKFYATMQLWSSVGGQIKRQVKAKQRQLGILSKVRIRKNRITGRDRTVIAPIYHSLGIDDTGGCVDYLVDEKFWKKNSKSGVITATGMGPKPFEMTREKLVARIEEAELEEDLIELCGSVWADIEDACKVERKKRYE